MLETLTISSRWERFSTQQERWQRESDEIRKAFDEACERAKKLITSTNPKEK